MKRDTGFRRIIKYTYFYEKLEVKDQVILYESFHGKAMVDSPYAIFKMLVNDPKYRGYKHVWALNTTEGNLYAEEYTDHNNVEFVKVHSDKYLKYLAAAKYLINNTTFPPYFQKKAGQIYVNTWHGTPLKTLGKDMKGGLGQHKNIQRNFAHTDYLINPNIYTADKLVESHDLAGIYNGTIIHEGYPRVDLTLNANRDEIRNKMSRLVTIDKTKKIILYAPTWRGEVNSVSNTKDEIQQVIKELYQKIPDGYQLLLKVHTLMYKHIKNDKRLEEVCIPDWVDTNELLSVVDILITDYSSIFFDYLVTKKPIIFFMYDREIYETERGLYIRLDQLPGPICKDIEEVIDCMKNADTHLPFYEDKYQKYIKEFCPYDDGHATERNVEIIFQEKHTKNCFRVRNEKRNILLYCGGFLNNGITTSAINLLNNLDYSKYNLVVMDKSNYDATSTENMNKLNPMVKKFFRVGSMNTTIIESYKHNYLINKGLKNESLHKFIPRTLYNREVHRLFGDIEFDIVIDFSGYVPFWSLLFAFGNFKRKVIYQHNDMQAEYDKKINKKYKHRSNMNLIFPIYKYFDKIISVAEHTRDVNKANLQKYIPSEKAAYVHNCIDPEKVQSLVEEKSELLRVSHQQYLVMNNTTQNGILKFKGIMMPEEGKVHFVNMGRLSPEKDQKKLIIAFSKIAEVHDYVRLYIIGEGVLEHELKKLTIQLGVQDKVYFTGQLSNPFQLISTCDCFILSSNHEGQPMVLLEALIVGIPIISTDIPGSRSILQNGYGELVENSVDGLVLGMEKYLMNQLLTREFDYRTYNREALGMFYREVCGEEVEKNSVLQETKLGIYLDHTS
ncbi:spore coat protein CotS [Heyndrickxia camelliae]|uniref:Spore coat protein CotS n=2 Tax=Heyndrickxia camelliae TaxID=1707093 RepID=A0A2N3LDH7_9BACI|nr:spore coat protein CotS [Heyndrickxia camelliae]